MCHGRFGRRGIGRQLLIRIDGDGFDRGQFLQQLPEADFDSQPVLKRARSLGEQQGIKTKFEKRGLGINAAQINTAQLSEHSLDGLNQSFLPIIIHNLMIPSDSGSN